MSFGALVDHFGVTEALGPLLDKVDIIEDPREPRAQNRVDATDINGDTAATAYHGNTAGLIFEIGNTFQLKAGQSIDTEDLLLGELEAGIIVESININTQNTGGNPRIEYSGIEGSGAVEAPTGKKNTFKMPSVTINGRMVAQAIGFTITAGELQTTSMSASITIEEDQTGVGEPAAFGVKGGTGEVSASFTDIGTQVDVTEVAGFTQSKNEGKSGSQAAWAGTDVTFGFTPLREDV